MTTHGTFSTAEEEKLRGRTPGEIIADMEQLCQERGFFYSLCLMVARFLWTSTDRAVSTDWTDVPNQGELSWLFGLLAKNHIVLEEIPTDEVILDQVYKSVALLRELHMVLAFPTPFDNDNTQEQTLDPPTNWQEKYENWMHCGLGMVEPIFYGGEGAYDFQYLEMASKRYEADEKWIREHKGADLDTFVKIADELAQLTLNRLLTIDNSANLRSQCTQILSIMSFCRDDLPDVSQESWEYFCNAFSFVPGNINGQFRSVGDYNKVHSHPLMTIAEGRFCLPIYANLPKAIYESPYYWMVNDSAYGNSASDNRGKATESIAKEILLPIFERDRIFREVKVRRGKTDFTDLDILAVSGSKAVIVQCKSKKLTIEARGGDGTAIGKDFTRAVQDAYDQGIKGRRALIEGGFQLSDENGNAVRLTEEINEVFILCVTGDHYPAVMTQARTFLKKQDDDPFPILVSVFDLDIISFYLTDRYEFLYYLRQRSIHAPHFVSDSEVSLLGFHLQHKLYPAEDYEGILVKGGFSQLVSANFVASRGHWPWPVACETLHHAWKTESFNNLLEDIKLIAKKAPKQIAVEDLFFFMYDLAGEGSEDLIGSAETLKEEASRDGKFHSLRIRMDKHEKGVTLAIFPTSEHNPLAGLSQAELVKGIGLAHKYISKADEWVVLASFADRPSRFDMFGYTKEPWKPDSEMDQLIEIGFKPRIPALTDGTRPSRNRSCICGSGRKFKRCCGK